ncbi:MAG: response regulator [Mariprofundales bacterium]
MKNLRIMVVDDIEQNRYMLTYMLQSQGALVSAAEHGKQALDQLLATPHDMIISDILMPVMDGYQLCRECKLHATLRQIPFVFYTATYTTDEDRQFSLDLGANRFIIKPEQPEALLKILRELLEEQQKGEMVALEPNFEGETELLQRYNSRLVRKLEDKLVQLEESKRQLDEEITRRNALTSELAHAQRMEAVGTLVSGVAHNFNNVLVGVMGKSYLAKSKLGKDNAFVEHQLNDIETLANHASDIVRQLMNYTRKTREKNELFPLETLVTETVETSRIGIPSHTQLRTSLTITMLPIRGDSSQVQQVIMNLINNARDAVANRNTRWIEVSLQQQIIDDSNAQNHTPNLAQGVWAHLSIRDSGCGISAAHQQQIFDPFFTTKEKEKGTGLGLSTAYAIIERHGGTICCQSTLDQGTCFDIHLPVEGKEPPKTHSKTPTVMIPGNGETILLVEDEDSVRQTTAAILTRLGYHTLTACNGKEGLAQFNQHDDIALVLTDVVMPEMGGMELLSAIIKQDNKVPIVLASGYNLDMSDLSSEELARTQLLAKPYHAAPLSQLLHSMISKT